MSFETSEELDLIWESIKNEMEQSKTISESSFNTWFSNFKLVSLDKNKIVFSAANEMKRKMIVSNFSDFIRGCVASTIGSCPKLEVICDAPQLEINNPMIHTVHPVIEEGSCHGLNPEYTFDNFVVGSSNRFAHACGVAVSNDPGGSHGYNPLFIYGPSGLGKTHLMYAVANKVHADHPEMTIICVKSEDFMNELIESIAKKNTHAFREK